MAQTAVAPTPKRADLRRAGEAIARRILIEMRRTRDPWYGYRGWLQTCAVLAHGRKL